MSEERQTPPVGRISYSSGMGSSDPWRFRPLGRRMSPLAFAVRTWPELAPRGGPPIVVNAYPAPVTEDSSGLVVDCYMSTNVACRAIRLAGLVGRDCLLIAQPLFALHLLLALRGDSPWPSGLTVASGGYPMPWSLERYVKKLGSERGSKVQVVHCYGVAEVDAACLIAMRNEGKEPVYFHRPDVEVLIKGDDLWLGLREFEGSPAMAAVETGDRAELVDGGIRLCEGVRWSAKIMSELEAFGEADWNRRTGYRGADGRWQLRSMTPVGSSDEISYGSYCEETEWDWTHKPLWA